MGARRHFTDEQVLQVRQIYEARRRLLREIRRLNYERKKLPTIADVARKWGCHERTLQGVCRRDTYKTVIQVRKQA